MQILTLQNSLQSLAKQGINTLSTRMLEHYFPKERTEAFRKTLTSAVKRGVLERVCRGVYVYPPSFNHEIHKLEKIAVVLRMGGYSYLSLESALSEYGVISQLPLNRITAMTTGRSQTYSTPYGVIEFTHTQRDDADILANTTKIKGRPLRMASVQMALADLHRVGRNVDLVNQSIYQEITHANDTL